MIIKVADTVFEIKNKYAHWEKFVTEYLTNEEPEFCIDFDEAFLMGANQNSRNESTPLWYTEYLEAYRKICGYILENKNGILMHGAVIGFEGCAYMFTAPSGTGKTTHIRQWQKAYGDKVVVINGDKPLIRLVDGEFIAYGTPWCGKEHLNQNISAPLKGIVMVARGEENSIEKVSPDTFNTFLIKQLYLPKNVQGISRALDFADKLFTQVPIYTLHCNISPKAAIVACEEIHIKK